MILMKVCMKEWIFRSGALVIRVPIFFSVESKMSKASSKAGFFRIYASDGLINPVFLRKSRLFFRMSVPETENYIQSEIQSFLIPTVYDMSWLL